MGDDPWDRFPDAPATPQQGRAPNIFDPFDNAPASPPQPTVRRLPPGSDGGYSIEDGKIVIHIGGHKLHPLDRPQVGADDSGQASRRVAACCEIGSPTYP
jgi:hypothetical protein